MISPLRLGSTTIEPIVKDLRKLESSLGHVKKYLQLPQQKPLGEQLQEAGSLIDGSYVIYTAIISPCRILFYSGPAVSYRVADLSSASERSELKIGTVEAQLHQLGADAHSITIIIDTS